MTTRLSLTISVLLLSLVAGCSGGSAGSAPDRTGAASPPANFGRADQAAAYVELMDSAAAPSDLPGEGSGPEMPGDRFNLIVENPFVRVADQPLSTFSIDVDTASYAKTRMFLLEQNVLPPPDAVRIEEFVNYFPYNYSPPQGDDPFALHVETAAAPWCREHRLVRVAIKGRSVDRQQIPYNLVFLLDVSGSMDYADKLPLVKRGMRKLVTQLGAQDRVAIVVYAGAAGTVLPSTPGDRHELIEAALEQLHAGGSTNGGQGIRLAYRMARNQFIEGGVNRVLLCSDGDFNLGVTSPAALVRLAQENAEHGIFLTVLGFGMGNHNDALLEELSNRANGNYAFIDTEREVEKVLGQQIESTLVTIAKDVKIQVEFNPARVASYRLIGYENRALEAADFNNDRIDAGEVGAGHTVTALYELAMLGPDEAADPLVDPLRYQTPRQLSTAAATHELLTLKVRYKRPAAVASQLMVHRVPNEAAPFEQASDDFRFSAAVASFGMLLRNSKYRGQTTYAAVRKMAAAARGADPHGHRAEFLVLVDKARQLERFTSSAPSAAWQEVVSP